MLNYRCFASHPLRRTALAAAVGAMSLALFAPAAQADIQFFPGSGFVQPPENILFSRPGLILGPAITVTGATNQTETIVTFTGDENLVGNGGQARVEAQDGLFSNLLVDLADPGLTFTQFETNVNLATSGLISITVTEANGQVNNFSFQGTAGGSNFFGINAILGQQINTININSEGNLDRVGDFRQIRIGGINRNGVAVPPVPEPSEWLAMGMAAASVGGLMVRARRRKSLAA